MPVLGVCGDSFMAATIHFPDRPDTKDSEGKHFTEILSKKIGYDYFTLARGACSNSAIRLQIDEMVKQKVDLVIIGCTSGNRLELPHINRKYVRNLGVYNLDYKTDRYPDLSTKNNKFKHSLISETLTNIFTDDRPFYKKIFNTINFIDNNQLTALEYYIDYILDHEYKAEMDRWILQSGIKLLEDNSINYIMILNGVLQHEEKKYNYYNNTKFIPYDSKLNPATYPYGTRRWHTNDSSQEKIADLWYNYIIDNNFLHV